MEGVKEDIPLTQSKIKGNRIQNKSAIELQSTSFQVTLQGGKDLHGPKDPTENPGRLSVHIFIGIQENPEWKLGGEGQC